MDHPIGYAVVSNRTRMVIAKYLVDDPNDLGAAKLEAQLESAQLIDDSGKHWTRVAPWYATGGTRGA